MKRTKNILMTLFWSLLFVAGIIYLIADVLDVDIAFLSNVSQQGRFVVSTTMILLTLALVPTSLRLFRFKRVSADLLSRKEKALCKWGTIRMTTLGMLLIVNTVLYYAFGFEPSFGYLAVVVLLTMPFVFPTMSRCVAETEPETQPELEPENDQKPEGNEEV